ncbi:OB-fold nucleic acid binding domain-containing protein [Bacillus sp. JCM 19034]|uniref:OB-fold nucleic acid binding domain-containing protein n=1 Tax=Bacillus sp. JCM 19034 TaxID=1481928 RepID=UPI0007845B6C|nr:OB-fold nucleic acid binding domain-containing protein [Bacillus sp. JCM 19034]
MAFASLVDETGTINVTMFPLVWSNVRDFLKEDELYVLDGRTDLAKQRPTLIIERLYPLESANKSNQRLYLRIMNETKKEKLQMLKQVIQKHRGDVPVILFYDQTNETKYLTKEYSINPSNACLYKLSQLLGQENVKLRS